MLALVCVFVCVSVCVCVLNLRCGPCVLFLWWGCLGGHHIVRACKGSFPSCAVCLCGRAPCGALPRASSATPRSASLTNAIHLLPSPTRNTHTKAFTNEAYEKQRFQDAVRAYQGYSITTQASLSLLNGGVMLQH